MPCRVEPTAQETERKELNKDAARLHEWLDTILQEQNQDLDETAKLCKKITELGNEQFLDLMAKHIHLRSARELIGWWEKHFEYDVHWGRKK